MVDSQSVIPTERIEGAILVIRGCRVILSTHLADLYEVEPRVVAGCGKRGVQRGEAPLPRVWGCPPDTIFPPSWPGRGSGGWSKGFFSTLLVQAVKRNLDRFPQDFMFQLTAEEFANLRFQIGASSLRSQIDTSSWGGRRYPPFAFTEQGVAMLSSVLRSQRAVQVNIEIMRAFVRLRRMLASNAELSRRLDELEQKYDQQFKAVVDAIRQLMAPP